MKTVQENIARVEYLSAICQDHLVGGKLSMDSHLTYLFHEPHLGLNGIRVSLEKGKINALEIAIKKLDEIYNDEFSWSSHHTELKSI